MLKWQILKTLQRLNFDQKCNIGLTKLLKLQFQLFKKVKKNHKTKKFMELRISLFEAETCIIEVAWFAFKLFSEFALSFQSCTKLCKQMTHDQKLAKSFIKNDNFTKFHFQKSFQYFSKVSFWNMGVVQNMAGNAKIVFLH